MSEPDDLLERVARACVRCRLKARDLYANDDIQIDDDAIVSVGDDDGAWVAAWVWVPMARCRCADPSCPACAGECNVPSTTTLYRLDMVDRTGTPMCDACASDAYGSGLFDRERTDEDHDEGDDGVDQGPTEE